MSRDAILTLLFIAGITYAIIARRTGLPFEPEAPSSGPPPVQPDELNRCPPGYTLVVGFSGALCLPV